MRVFENQEARRAAEQRAVLIILMATVICDDTVSQAKAKRLGLICSFSPIFEGNSKEEINADIKFATGVITRLGWNAIEQAAEVLSLELRETAVAFAIELLFADNAILNDKGEHFIYRLMEMLQIRDEVASTILRVSFIRARGL